MATERLKRINELAAISKTRELTGQEKEEQARLRREYLAAFKANLTAQLDNTYIVDSNGNKIPVKDRKKKKED